MAKASGKVVADEAIANPTASLPTPADRTTAKGTQQRPSWASRRPSLPSPPGNRPIGPTPSGGCLRHIEIGSGRRLRSRPCIRFRTPSRPSEPASARSLSATDSSASYPSSTFFSLRAMPTTKKQ